MVYFGKQGAHENVSVLDAFYAFHLQLWKSLLSILQLNLLISFSVWRTQFHLKYKIFKNWYPTVYKI